MAEAIQIATRSAYSAAVLSFDAAFHKRAAEAKRDLARVLRLTHEMRIANAKVS